MSEKMLPEPAAEGKNADEKGRPKAALADLKGLWKESCVDGSLSTDLYCSRRTGHCSPCVPGVRVETVPAAERTDFTKMFRSAANVNGGSSS